MKYYLIHEYYCFDLLMYVEEILECDSEQEARDILTSLKQDPNYKGYRLIQGNLLEEKYTYGNN